MERTATERELQLTGNMLYDFSHQSAGTTGKAAGLRVTRLWAVCPQLQVPNSGSLNTEHEPGNEPTSSSVRIPFPYD
jgi:hypothetical protein